MNSTPTNRIPLEERPVFADAEHGVLDFVRGAPGEERSEIYNETLSAFRVRYPEAYLTNFKEANDLKRKQFLREPKRIDREEFERKLNLLPPEDWTGGPGESFKMSERIFDDLTEILIRIGRDYYSMVDSYQLSHKEVYLRVQAWLECDSSAIGETSP